MQSRNGPIDVRIPRGEPSPPWTLKEALVATAIVVAIIVLLQLFS